MRMTDPQAGTAGRDPKSAAEQLAPAEEFILLMATCTIHCSTCPSVPSGSEVNDGRGALEDMVLRSKSLAELEYALLQIGEPVRTCSACQPGSDPKGLAMWAAYASNIRERPPQARP